MNDTYQADPHELATFTAEIAAAYVGHHTLASSDLPELIKTISNELGELGQAPAEPETEKLKPAVPIKRSVRPDSIICLEDGKPLIMLKLRIPMKAVSEFDRRRTLGPIEGGHRIRPKPDSLMALMLTVE